MNFSILLILFIFSVALPELLAGSKILYDRSYALNSGKIVFLKSNLAAVRIIEWEGEDDSVRLIIKTSPKLTPDLISNDFLDYIEIEFASTEVGAEGSFSIVDAPVHWWKNFYGLMEKVDTELFYIDLYVSPNLLMLQAEIYNGSLNAYNGFPTSMQLYLNQSEGKLQGSYWMLLAQLENSNLIVETAQTIMISASYSNVNVLRCNNFMASASHSVVSLSSSDKVDFYGEYCTLEITFAKMLSSRVLSHSEVKVFFLKEAEIKGSETKIDIWYLLSKLDMNGENLNLNIRYLGRSMNEISIAGKMINADLGLNCKNGLDYLISAINSEVHLSCNNFIFNEEKEIKSGKCQDKNHGRVLNLNLDIEKSKINLCKTP